MLFLKKSMVDPFQILKDKSLVIILAYAPTGLGHLRVTDALYDGLPKETTPLLLGAQDRRLTYIHRLGSIHPLTRRFTEWIQNGWAQDWLYKRIFVRYLKNHTENIYKQMVTILEQRIDLPKTVLVVSTHFGLTHQLAEIKETLAKNLHVRIILVVIVTDDSPQHIWYTQGADLTFVPSEKTRHELLKFGRQNNLRQIDIEVVSYPVSPLLGKELTDEEWQSKIAQADPQNEQKIQVSMPVSGAAVGLDYYTNLVEILNLYTPRFNFHTVAKVAPFTQSFLTKMMTRKYMNLYVSTHDRELVDLYRDLYQNTVILLEITKPSEQAFKALFTPRQHGGSILLFSWPVGRQEYDNLQFLRRHQLLPREGEMKQLHERAVKDNALGDDQEGRQLLAAAENWRGIELPHDPHLAAKCIWWLFKEKVFMKMLRCQLRLRSDDEHAHELTASGVEKIWQRISVYLKNLPP